MKICLVHEPILNHPFFARTKAIAAVYDIQLIDTLKKPDGFIIFIPKYTENFSERFDKQFVYALSSEKPILVILESEYFIHDKIPIIIYNDCHIKQKYFPINKSDLFKKMVNLSYIMIGMHSLGKS